MHSPWALTAQPIDVLKLGREMCVVATWDVKANKKILPPAARSQVGVLEASSGRRAFAFKVCVKLILVGKVEISDDEGILKTVHLHASDTALECDTNDTSRVRPIRN